MQGKLKGITAEEEQYYIRLTGREWNWHSKAVAVSYRPAADPERAREGFEDVIYWAEGIMDPTLSAREPEWVYVLANKGIPGVCKIGMTTTSVSQRIREINAATGVVTPWFEIYKYKCINARVLEEAVHQKLEEAGYRISHNREGFAMRSDLAISVIEELGKALTVRPRDFKPDNI